MIRPLTNLAVLLLAYCWKNQAVIAFYLPGVNPQSFGEGDQVKLKVNKMTSTHTLLPLDYYHLPYCHPDEGVKMDNENLGEFLAGDRIKNSPYVLYVKKDMYCEQLCVANVGRAHEAGVSPNKVVKAIRKNYHNNWIVDNLPAASKVEDDEHVTTRYWQGFPVGFVTKQDMKAYIHNHINIEIMYHAVEADRYRVVRFTVQPFSIHHEIEPASGKDILDDKLLPTNYKIINPIDSCKPGKSIPEHTNYDMVIAPGQKPQEASGLVLFTYDVIWTENRELKWASRWDIYLSMDNAVPTKVHWHSITISLVIAFALLAILTTILVRNLRREMKLSEDLESQADELKKCSWMLVHGDVFRPPSSSPMLLSLACGTGAQLLLTTLVSIFFAMLGFMNPSRRGHFVMGSILFYVLMGFANGFVTVRFYKTFNKDIHWMPAAKKAAYGFSGLAFGIFFVNNVGAMMNLSSAAVPFATLLTLLVLWNAIATPLVFLGAFLASKCDTIEFPVSTSSVPREIPEQPWYSKGPGLTMTFCGILMFISICVELHFILQSAWLGFYYYLFGYLFLVLLIFIITCATTTMLCTYLQLCGEDYHWWWRSFCNGGSVGIVFFIYSQLWCSQSLTRLKSFAFVIYNTYMLLVSVGLFSMMGYVGLSASLWLNKTLYSVVAFDGAPAGYEGIELEEN